MLIEMKPLPDRLEAVFVIFECLSGKQFSGRVFKHPKELFFCWILDYTCLTICRAVDAPKELGIIHLAS